jgi:hypothetical protein
VLAIAASGTQTGTVTVSGNIYASSLTVNSGAYDLLLTGVTKVVSNAITFNNTGILQLGALSTDTHTFTAGATAIAPIEVKLAGSFSSTSASYTIGDADTPITLLTNTSFDISAALPNTTNTYSSNTTWVVPTGVSALTVDARGAGSSGLGGRVQATVAVTPGDALLVQFAGAGAGGIGKGWPGNGLAGGNYAGLFVTSVSASNALVIAGGGGGNGGSGAAGGNGGGGETRSDPGNPLQSLRQRQYRRN